jgi:VanZ family protein
MLASGVSLHRVLLPIVVCSLGVNALVLIDNELVIPRYKYQMARSRGDVIGADSFRLPPVSDNLNSVWYSRWMNPSNGGRLQQPLVNLRDDQGRYLGHLTAPVALYDQAAGRWTFQPANALCPMDLKELSNVNSDHPVRALPSGVMVFCDARCLAAYEKLTPAQRAALPDTQLCLPRLHVPTWRQAGTSDFVPAELTPREIFDTLRRLEENRNVNVAAQGWLSVNVRDTAAGVNVVADRLRVRNVQGRLQGGELENVRFEYCPQNRTLATFTARRATYVVDGPLGGWRLEGGQLTYASDSNPADLTLRQSSDWLSFMSSGELSRLLRTAHLPDPSDAILTRHARFADFFNNLIMLLVSVPFILSRERNIKASALMTVLSVGVVFAFVYMVRHIHMAPSLAAWLPILVFGSLAAAMVAAVKT